MQNTINENTLITLKAPEKFDASIHKYGSLCFSRGSEGYDKMQPWLVKNLFPMSSFGVIFGKSGSYKSFLAVDICCSIVTGKAWNNYKVKKGGVVYVAAEGATGIKRRVKVWEKFNGNVTADNLFILGQSLSVDVIGVQVDLIQAIEEIEQKNNVKIELVVLDTLARCFTGDENSSRDMSNFVRGCDFIKAAVNTSIMCIHHCGKDQSKGLRGSSALLAACDFEFQVKRNGKEKLITFVNNKQKDAQEAPDMTMEFETVDLDIYCDENKVVTSLVRTKVAQYKNSNDPQESNPIIDILTACLNKSCTRGELRAALYPQSNGSLSNTERQKLSRMLNELISSGEIVVKQIGQRATQDDMIHIVN
jgi:hypothetical protein